MIKGTNSRQYCCVLQDTIAERFGCVLVDFVNHCFEMIKSGDFKGLVSLRISIDIGCQSKERGILYAKMSVGGYWANIDNMLLINCVYF